MKKSSACLRSYFPVVDLRLVEEPPFCSVEERSEEAADSGIDLHLPAGVTSLQHWLDLNA